MCSAGYQKGVRTEEIVLLNGDVMKEVDESGYKYLGVLEGTDIKGKEIKEKVSREYFKRVKLLAR